MVLRAILVASGALAMALACVVAVVYWAYDLWRRT
jgi:hypothetical protein